MRPTTAIACMLSLLVPLDVFADSTAPVDIASVNEALRTALRCTTRTGPKPAPECRALVEGSRERVAFPALGERGHPSAWTSEMTLLRSDGSLLRLDGDMNRAFHGMVWVPEAGLYVGYASWYGEEGSTLVFHPDDADLTRMVGVPVLSPDGGFLASANIDIYSDGELRLELFEMTPVGPKLLVTERHNTTAMQAEAVAFAGSTLLIGADLGSAPQLFSFDLSAHLPATTPGLLTTDRCSQSKMAHYLTGDQVFLRREPTASGAIEAALPWGTCVLGLGTFGDWMLVRVADQHGFVASRFLSPTPPPQGTLPSTVQGGF